MPGIFLIISTLPSYATWGIIALLIVVFSANIHHFTSSPKVKGVGKAMLVLTYHITRFSLVTTIDNMGLPMDGLSSG